ncbi:hypothetical protein [Pleurocapsa sp. PCC 7319]|uniref:hypothetical protein n=1 Tax=Pleurocapsa sp. PCC 7319 TaxID=118161 RepID=UPI0011818FE1|nr:hypothetical protein [Pleurocapsa sp. PCC 7319]
MTWIKSNSTKRVLFTTLFLNSLCVTLAVVGAVTVDRSPDFHFQEGRFITIVSCIQLLIAASLSWKIYQLAKGSQLEKLSQSSLFWLIVSWGLFFLTLDDAIGIHEQIDFWLHDLFRIEETDITDLADDLIVGGYLLLFLIYIVIKWQIIQIYKRSFIFFKIGFLLSLMMVVLDIVTNNEYFISMMIDNEIQARMLRKWLSALEDSVKIFAEGIFIVGIYQCWQIAQSLYSSKDQNLLKSTHEK